MQADATRLRGAVELVRADRLGVGVSIYVNSRTFSTQKSSVKGDLVVMTAAMEAGLNEWSTEYHSMDNQQFRVYMYKNVVMPRDPYTHKVLWRALPKDWTKIEKNSSSIDDTAYSIYDGTCETHDFTAACSGKFSVCG